MRHTRECNTSSYFNRTKNRNDLLVLRDPQIFDLENVNINLNVEKIFALQSAKTNLNVEQVFFTIARDIKQKLADSDSKAEVLEFSHRSPLTNE